MTLDMVEVKRIKFYFYNLKSRVDSVPAPTVLKWLLN